MFLKFTTNYLKAPTKKMFFCITQLSLLKIGFSFIVRSREMGYTAKETSLG